MSLTLGEKLRQAREERGISISEVAEQTRISSMYLEMIENDDYRTLPGGIFNKGFVKSYAKYVGLDEQEALLDYARLISSSEESSPENSKTYRPEVLTDDRTSGSMIPTIIFAVIILGLMTWGVLELVKYVQKNQGGVPIANTNPNQNANMNSNSAVPPSMEVANVPPMAGLKIEFKTSGEDISLNATLDGKKSSPLVKTTAPAQFQPTQDLELSYLRLKAPFAQLTINGKEIKLPAAPAVPTDRLIRFKIDSSTLPSIWSKGEVTFSDAPPADANTNTAPVTPPVNATPRATPPKTAATPKPAASPAATPARATPTPARPTNTPRPRNSP